MPIICRKYKDDNLNTHVSNGARVLMDNYFINKDYEFVDLPKELNATDLIRKLAFATMSVSDYEKNGTYYKKINVESFKDFDLLELSYENEIISISIVKEKSKYNTVVLYTDIPKELEQKYYIIIKQNMDLLALLLNENPKLVNIKKDLN